MIAAGRLAAGELTSLAITRLPKRLWRSIHLTSYAVFWLTSIYAALVGHGPGQLALPTRRRGLIDRTE